MENNGHLMWEMNLDVLEEFYRRSIERNAESEKEKMDILLELAEEGRMNRVTATKRSKEQIIADLKKNFNAVKAEDLFDNKED